MRRLVKWMNLLDMNIWFICHEVPEWGMVDGQRTEIGRVEDVWEKLRYELDLAIQATRRGASRYATVKKTRLLAFPEQETFPLEYAEFASRAGKDAVEAASEAITLALPAQVAEVKHLLEIVRIAEADIQKGFEKAEVSDWSEMTSDQITKWIKFLKSKISA